MEALYSTAVNCFRIKSIFNRGKCKYFPWGCYKKQTTTRNLSRQLYRCSYFVKNHQRSVTSLYIFQNFSSGCLQQNWLKGWVKLDLNGRYWPLERKLQPFTLHKGGGVYSWKLRNIKVSITSHLLPLNTFQPWTANRLVITVLGRYKLTAYINLYSWWELTKIPSVIGC